MDPKFVGASFVKRKRKAVWDPNKTKVSLKIGLGHLYASKGVGPWECGAHSCDCTVVMIVQVYDAKNVGDLAFLI